MKHKHYDYIVAWAEGKEIQVYRRDDGWINDNSPSWHFSEEYRIKPESTCPRCGKVHTCDPVDPDKILKEQAKEIVDSIDASILRNLNQRRSKEYRDEEYRYCQREEADFFAEPTEENRRRILSKRIEFAVICSGGVNGSTASVNWVAGGGAGTGYKW